MSNTDDIQAALNKRITEVLDLRFGAKMPPLSATPTDVLAALHDVRQRLDRIEELYTEALYYKGSVDRSAAIVTATADDAWNHAIRKVRTSPMQIGGGEYSSARERHAEADLAILDQRIAAREAADLAARCAEAVDIIRVARTGLDGMRHDILTTLRAMAFESHLER